MDNKYTVSQLTKLIKDSLTVRFPAILTVGGEITDYSVASSGHIYFSLKEGNSLIKCVYFKMDITRDALKLNPVNGMAVNVIGTVTVYEPTGTYQIRVRDIKPTVDLIGEQFKKVEETKKKLEQEGLFSRKRAVSPFVRRVAILTSVQGAAQKDILKGLLHYGHCFFQIDWYNIPAQGVQNKSEIVATIERVNAISRNSDEPYDLLVLTRGGGSLEDLMLFNEEDVARAMYSSDIPTVSAIGHERDNSVTDFVADVRIATPTAVAHYLQQGYQSYVVKYEQLIESIVSSANDAVNNKWQRYDTCTLILQNYFNVNNNTNYIRIEQNKLAHELSKLRSVLSERVLRSKTLVDQTLIRLNPSDVQVYSYRLMLGELINSIARVVDNELISYKNKIDTPITLQSQLVQSRYGLARRRLGDGLMSIVSNRVHHLLIERESHRVSLLMSEIRRHLDSRNVALSTMLSGLTIKIEERNIRKTLEKGFALVDKDGVNVSRSSELKVGDVVTIRFSDGSVKAHIVK